MDSIPRRLLRYDGSSIEHRMHDLAPRVTLDSFLYDTIGLDRETATTIAEEVRGTPVAIAETDAMALSLEDVPQHEEGVSRLTDLLLPSPDKINIRSGMVDVFSKATIEHNPGIFPVTREQAKQSAVTMTAIYELGEFVSRKVYGLLVKKSRTNPDQMPQSTEEIQSYFSRVVSDFVARDPEDHLPEDIDAMTPSEEASVVYFRNTRPKRFCATGGWLLVSMVEPRIRTSLYIDALRNHQFDNLRLDYILPPEDLGALYPLQYSEFDLLCSSIKRDYDVDNTVVSLFEARGVQDEQ